MEGFQHPPERVAIVRGQLNRRAEIGVVGDVVDVALISWSSAAPVCG